MRKLGLQNAKRKKKHTSKNHCYHSYRATELDGTRNSFVNKPFEFVLNQKFCLKNNLHKCCEGDASPFLFY